jgi:phosphomannomutase/phosphoglucomutase
LPSDIDVNDRKNDKEKQSIFCFLDVSGSCWGYKERFYKAFKSIPTTIKVRLFSFDDAVYAGCRFIEIVAKKKMLDPNFKVSQLLDSLPFPEGALDVRHPCKDELKKSVLEELAKIFAENKNIFINPIKDIITIDGLRLVFEDGYAIIRQSNTEPVFTMGFEAQTLENAESYKNTMLRLVDDLISRFG